MIYLFIPLTKHEAKTGIRKEVINKLDELQENLKVKFYKLNNKKIDLKSKLICILFLIFFVICVFKEVIL